MFPPKMSVSSFFTRIFPSIYPNRLSHRKKTKQDNFQNYTTNLLLYLHTQMVSFTNGYRLIQSINNDTSNMFKCKINYISNIQIITCQTFVTNENYGFEGRCTVKAIEQTSTREGIKRFDEA